MGFYGRHVLPRHIDVAMKNPETARLRAAWIPLAKGEVVEVAIGSGLNLPLYSAEVKHVHGVDPSPQLLQMTLRRAAAGSLKVETIAQSAEEPLALANECIDTVVLTWTLCSIPDPHKALEQMRRVLRPTGQLIFVEHGRAPDPVVVAWQQRLTPVWRRFTGGCHLDRKIDRLINEAGFRISDLQTCYLPGPRPMTYTYQGVAQVG